MDSDNDNAFLNTLSADALFELALTTNDNDQAWNAISRLHTIATDDVFTKAVHLCHSQNALERSLGVNVIAQIGLPQHTYQEPTVQLLLQLIETEDSPIVLESIGMALGHRNDERAVEPLLPFQQHPDPSVRYSVAFGLLGQTNPRAIACLIALSADPDTDIRDWATFGLAQQIDTDTPAIREAFIARLHDPSGNTAGEAMVGLARRKDARVIAPLMQLLQAGDAGSLLFEAAATLGDPVLLPILEQIRTHWEGDHDWQYRTLIEAIDACTPNAVE